MSFLRRITQRNGRAPAPAGSYVYGIGPQGVVELGTKSSANPLLDVFNGITTDDAGDLANNAQGFAKAYQASVWAYRCVKLRAQTLASIPLKVVDAAGNDAPQHPLSRVATRYPAGVDQAPESADD